MGYSHYWTQQKECSHEEWEAICLAFRKMQAAALITKPLPIQQDEGNSNPPSIDSEFIVFNGIGQEAHEPMSLAINSHGFNFCKTRGKDYDSAVVALLCIANHCSPGTWYITSDGDPDEWAEGLSLARTAIPDCELPQRIYRELP